MISGLGLLGEAMHRLFVAIRPPAAIRELLLGAMGGISGARWQSEDQLHLTLRFIGEVDRHRAGDIHAALGARPPAAVRARPERHRRVRAARPAGRGLGRRRRRTSRSKALHKKVDAALARVGVAPDERAYLPHITLARLKRSSGPVGNLLEQCRRPRQPAFHRRSFRPVRKRPHRRGGGLFDRRALSARLGAGCASSSRSTIGA